MNFHGGSNNGGEIRTGGSEFATNAINMRTASPFRSTIVQNTSDVVHNGVWKEAKGQDFSQMVLSRAPNHRQNENSAATTQQHQASRNRHATQMIVPLKNTSNQDLDQEVAQQSRFLPANNRMYTTAGPTLWNTNSGSPQKQAAAARFGSGTTVPGKVEMTIQGQHKSIAAPKTGRR